MTFYIGTSRLECKKWRRKNTGTWVMVMQIHIYVKCVLSRLLLQCFFLADIFVVRCYFNSLLPLFVLSCYRLFWCTLNIAVCKSCSLACIECPICRTKIADRIFAFTWLCSSSAWNDGAQKGLSPHESHFTLTFVHTYILKNISYSLCLLFTAGVHLFLSTCHFYDILLLVQLYVNFRLPYSNSISFLQCT